LTWSFPSWYGLLDPVTGGGGIYLDGAKATIKNCLIQGNEAIGANFLYQWPTYGAGIYAYSTELTLTNCVVTDNAVTYGHGGGLYVYGSGAKVTNCTIAGNVDDLGATGGIEIAGTAAAAVIVNTVLWNNTGAEVTGSATVTYSDVEGGFAGTGNIDADPLFVGSGDYHLDAGSPCIDVGTNTAPQIPSTDIDGLPRISDGDCNGVFVVDMGADERLTSCGWGVASSLPADPREAGEQGRSSRANLLILLFAPAVGVLLWKGLRRRR
jgi:hypothetical protein